MDNYTPDPFSNDTDTSTNNNTNENNTYGSGAYNNANGNNAYGYQNTPNCPSYSMWLTLSILCAVMLNTICGIIGIVYVVMGNNAFKAGDYAQYESNTKTMKIALLIGLILGIFTIISYIFYISAMFSSYY